jgi:RNA polymerase sigma factor FliA
MSIPAHTEVIENELWTEFAKTGSADIRERLFSMYAPLARTIAARMYRSRKDDAVAFTDYLQYGNVGLLEALSSFDNARQVSFATFSSRRIRGAILNGLARESEQAAQYRFWRQRSEQRVESLRTAVATAADRASFGEIVAITAGLVVGALLDDLHGSTEPIDRNVNNDPYASNEIRQLQDTIRHLIAQLPDKERAVVQGHYLDDKQFDALAQQLALTKGRISQLHAQAVLRLRGWLDGGPKLDRKL